MRQLKLRRYVPNPAMSLCGWYPLFYYLRHLNPEIYLSFLTLNDPPPTDLLKAGDTEQQAALLSKLKGANFNAPENTPDHASEILAAFDKLYETFI